MSSSSVQLNPVRVIGGGSGRRLLSIGLAIVNSCLRPFGLRLQKRDSPTRSFDCFFDHVKRLGFQFATIIDVGVANGTPTLYEAFPQAKFYLFEPVAEFRPTLEALKQRIDADIFMVAVGADDGETSFHVHDDLSGSSLLGQAEGAVLDGIRRTVRIARLDTLLPRQLARPVLLKLDTQGAELDALRGLGERLGEIELIIIETSLFAFRKGAPEFAETVAFMAERGYVVYDVIEGHMRALDDALAQVDLAFVRRDSRLRGDARFFDDTQLADYLGRYRPLADGIAEPKA